MEDNIRNLLRQEGGNEKADYFIELQNQNKDNYDDLLQVSSEKKLLEEEVHCLQYNLEK